MENFPPNSRSSRETPTGPPKKPVKKVERVVESEVVLRKKPLGKRFTEVFIGESAHNVWQYIAFDVLLPAAKEMVSDAISQGIERMLFGDSTARRRATGYRPGQSGQYTSYNRFSSVANTAMARREDPREVSRRNRANHNFDDIIIATKVEADEVIDRLFNLVDQYEVATVSDLYEMLGKSGNFTDERWGWTDVRGAQAVRARGGGYLLDLPAPIALD